MKIQQIKITAEMVKAHANMHHGKRRTLIKKYKIRGMSNADLAKLFGKTESMIEKDMQAIKKEVWAHLKTDKGSEEVLKAIYAELRLVNDEVVETTWNLASETEQDSVKLGCLKLIRESQSDVIKVMQSLGIIAKVPDKIKLDVGVDADEHINKILDDLTKK
ncbi:hypothetical protein KAR91_44440 [Candidatus Pacearchaeota archaeon]|nr:hypothetical protein [Candidatus Pacearchaeota archaeon]